MTSKVSKDSISSGNDSTSTSISLSASTSPLISTQLGMCRMTQEKLTSKYNLEELDPCPLCKVAIGYHTLSPSTTTSTTGTGGRDGAKSTLPVWKKDHHQVKPLLDRVEQILTADAVDKKYWPRCLVKVVTNGSETHSGC
jgi:hypothetical protein